jgi:polysaccharide export outer membrane protein
MMIACSAFLLLLSACAEKGAGPIVSTGDRYAGPQEAVASQVAQEYRLDAGDRIRLTVYNEPGVSGEFTVSSEGKVALPLIGEVPARGQTVAELAAAARARFADGYLREPRVSGEVVAYRPFFILGEVAAPGQYAYAVGLTAMNAVATAKGFTPRANRDLVQIRRQGETKETSYRLTPELLVFPGDTIRVGERYF